MASARLCDMLKIRLGSVARPPFSPGIIQSRNRPRPPYGRFAMPSSETEFCRKQAERLMRLAEHCSDPNTRAKVLELAQEWLQRASSKEPPPQAA